MCGLRPHEWANCELLQPLMSAIFPESHQEEHRVVLLEIATTQLLKLSDADTQCEALLDGPQNATMRERLSNAQLILALVNDNEEGMAAGGGHWSAIACRRSNWQNGIFVIEHYDSSGIACNEPMLCLASWTLLSMSGKRQRALPVVRDSWSSFLRFLR